VAGQHDVLRAAERIDRGQRPDGLASTGHTVRTISRAPRTGVVSTFDVPTA
jgi:hypothetical protein